MKERKRDTPVLSLYALFHCNLAFSLIDRADFPAVIERCYWPLLRLARAGHAIALEMTAWTLRTVDEIDPGFTDCLRGLWEDGAIDFVGSGYAQCIMPLIPSEANRWNLELGARHYERLLGRRPSVALVNEQTFSAGLTVLYREAGYRALVMDWSNCARYNGYDKALLYRPQRATGVREGEEIGLLWSHSIAFQKFARAARGEISLEEYLEYLRSHHSPAEDRVFTAYSNDAEVFDFSPGKGAEPRGDTARMRRILELIGAQKGMRLRRPVEILAEHDYGAGGALLRLHSVETPLVCKKQEKYNPVRWAVTGRDSAHLNARCLAVYRRLLALDRSGLLTPCEWTTMRETLTELWGSDFRTNTTDEKMASFNERMGWLSVETERRMREAGLGGPRACSTSGASVETTPSLPEPATANLLCLSSPCLTIGSALSGGYVKAPLVVEEADRVIVSTGHLEAELLKTRGLALGSLRFPLVSDEALLGTIGHGQYESIELGADFYSGHLIHTSRLGEKTTDLVRTSPEIGEDEAGVSICAVLETAIGAVEKTYHFRRGAAEFSLSYRLRTPGLLASILRLGIFTFLPHAFEREGLYYETVNGGREAERFYLAGHRVSHGSPVSRSISASSCLGATEGWVAVGDASKRVVICSERGTVRAVPMVEYRETGGSFFLRLYHSAGEIDDTAYWAWRGINEVSFTVRAERA